MKLKYILWASVACGCLVALLKMWSVAPAPVVAVACSAGCLDLLVGCVSSEVEWAPFDSLTSRTEPPCLPPLHQGAIGDRVSMVIRDRCAEGSVSTAANSFRRSSFFHIVAKGDSASASASLYSAEAVAQSADGSDDARQLAADAPTLPAAGHAPLHWFQFAVGAVANGVDFLRINVTLVHCLMPLDVLTSALTPEERQMQFRTTRYPESNVPLLARFRVRVPPTTAAPSSSPGPPASFVNGHWTSRSPSEQAEKAAQCARARSGNDDAPANSWSMTVDDALVWQAGDRAALAALTAQAPIDPVLCRGHALRCVEQAGVRLLFVGDSLCRELYAELLSVLRSELDIEKIWGDTEDKHRNDGLLFAMPRDLSSDGDVLRKGQLTGASAGPPAAASAGFLWAPKSNQVAEAIAQIESKFLHQWKGQTAIIIGFGLHDINEISLQEYLAAVDHSVRRAVRIQQNTAAPVYWMTMGWSWAVDRRRLRPRLELWARESARVAQQAGATGVLDLWHPSSSLKERSDGQHFGYWVARSFNQTGGGLIAKTVANQLLSLLGCPISS